MVSVSYLKSVHKYPKLPSYTSLCRHGSLPYSYTMAKAPLMKKDEKIHYTKRMVSLQFRKGWYSAIQRSYKLSVGFFSSRQNFSQIRQAERCRVRIHILKRVQ